MNKWRCNFENKIEYATRPATRQKRSKSSRALKTTKNTCVRNPKTKTHTTKQFIRILKNTTTLPSSISQPRSRHYQKNTNFTKQKFEQIFWKTKIIIQYIYDLKLDEEISYRLFTCLRWASRFCDCNASFFHFPASLTTLSTNTNFTKQKFEQIFWKWK